MNDILFGNNNKAVIKKLANRSFRSNKMRNVIAVIAIALTTFLFTAVLTIGMGAKGTLEYNMAKMIGTGADALVQGLSEEQFQQLKENSMFEKVGCWVPIEIMTNTNRIFAEIDYADQPQLELRMQTPRTGSAPQKANEVLVSANILNDLNIEEKIGAEIPIEFKNRQSGQMYHFDMIVSGIYDTPNEKSESVIVSKAFMEENPEMMNEIAQGREGCGMSILQTTELKKYYGTKPNITKALDGVNLSVEQGEFVAIVGTSGSGKSTLLNMIGGLDVPTSGNVIVDGRDLSTLKDEQLTIFRRRKIGFIFQNYNLVPVLNVFENIVLPVELDGNKVDKKFMKEVVRMLGLEDKLNNMPSNLSGGQQQRVAIARALVSKPAIVLADEPTGNLDSMTSSDVLSLLKVTSMKFHQTLVMITHNNEIAQLADRIIRIEDGKIVQ